MVTRPLGASVRGFAAWQISLLLDKPLRMRIAELECQPRVDGRYMQELREAFTDLRLAGQQWAEWHRAIFADESAEAAVTEIGTDSSQHDEMITPEEASVLLDVSPSRVRQLLRSGELPGRRVGGRWLIDCSDVVAYAGTPRGDVA
jgi:excisionase family DNA binding protein